MSHWHCRSCGIYGTYKSRDISFCGGAYFGWIIGATPTDGRTCCNCVKRVTGSDAGYFAWACDNCKARKEALERYNYNSAGFETGMQKEPLKTPEGMLWLKSDCGDQSGPEWLRRSVRVDFSGLSFESLSSLMPSFETYSNLTSIDVSDNILLEGLPIRSLCQMSTLQALHCTGCPRLISPPPEVSLQGGEVVMSFLRDIIDDGHRNTSMSLFLIGDGESGKTSVLKALRSKTKNCGPIPRDKRTVGIDIDHWPLQEFDEIDFIVYDMAGQSVYKDTHTYFVGRRAVYIFVWRLRRLSTSFDSEVIADMVKSWIDTLQFRVPGASILLVATHADVVSTEDAEKQLRIIQKCVLSQVSSVSLIPIRVYGNAESVIVDSLSGLGVAKLRETIISFAKTLPWYGEILPKKWMDLGNKVLQAQEEKKKYLSWNEYAILGSDCGLRDEALKSATVFLHETGKLRYFGFENMRLKKLSEVTPAECTKGLSYFDIICCLCVKAPKAPPSQILSETFTELVKERTLATTVYISPTWICNALKGIIRHDRENLLRHFMTMRDGTMVRRVQRSVSHARIHDSLIDYMWPSVPKSCAYWEDGLLPQEQDLWEEPIVSDKEEQNRALSILAGFDLIAIRGNELIVPVLMKKGVKHLKTTDAMSSVACPYFTEYSYASIPTGFVERIVVKISQWAFYIDFGSGSAVCYLRGNVGHISLLSSSREVSVLKIRASTRNLWTDMKRDVHSVEAFFPGLSRQSLVEIDPVTVSLLKDPIQILIVSSNIRSGKRVREAVISNDSSLTVEVHTMNSPRDETLDPRIVLVCVDKDIAKSALVAAQLRLYAHTGRQIIPLILPGFQIDNYERWWPESLDVMESFKLFVDLRFDFLGVVRNELVPQLVNFLNKWRGFGTHYSPHASNKIACIQCIVDGASPIGSFDRQDCMKTLQDWQSELLVRMNSKFGTTIVDSMCSLNDVASALSISEPSGPIVRCENSHHVEVETLLSEAAITPVIPCPHCINHAALKPHCFNRQNLLCVFDDDNISKSGLVNCPVCQESGRSYTLRILDILNTDIFVSYNWGVQKSTQKLVTPIVRKIELETDLICWFDIHGGLSAGQNINEEMRKGVERSTVVLLFLSDAYVNSLNCQREFISAVRFSKFMIPVLVPGSERTQAGHSCGWTGDSTRDWWKHAFYISQDYFDPDNPDSRIPWHRLADYSPIDMTAGPLIDTVCDEIVCRIMSRFHRGEHITDSLYEPSTMSLNSHEISNTHLDTPFIMLAKQLHLTPLESSTEISAVM